MSSYRQQWTSCRPEDVAARLYDGWHLDRITTTRNPQDGKPMQVAIMRRPLVLGDEDLPTIKHGVGGATRRCPDKHRAPVAHFIPLVGATGTFESRANAGDSAMPLDAGSAGNDPVSRLAVRRSAAATSEMRDATAGRDRQPIALTLSEPTGCADDCTHPDHGHRA